MTDSQRELTPRQIKEKLFNAKREKLIRECRRRFWIYCQTTAPGFYRDDRWHLRLMCEVLQALYERRLNKAQFRGLVEAFAPIWYSETIKWDEIKDDHIFTQLMMNLPPREGKSRTLVNLCKWILGKSTKNRVITGSYNDDLAQTFSRYTRDGISERRSRPAELIYSDIFPGTKIKQGNASYQEWALDGEFFNYRGTGVKGTITGKGGNVSIIDDPVKGAEEAYNETYLDGVWRWYVGTFLSRLEDAEPETDAPAVITDGDNEGGLQIVTMTRWSAGDICGRILAGPEASDWLVLHMEAAYNEEINVTTGESEPAHMLCPTLLSKRKYLSLRRNMDEAIFYANFHQTALDIKGRLYKEFKTYDNLPTVAGKSVVERIISYTDTADEGADFLCSWVAAVYKKQLYILDVLYTKAPMEITEPATAKMLVDNNTGEATIESNNGGRGFARNVERELLVKHKSRKPFIKWFHQTKNKIARILSNATYVLNNVYFPVNWATRWPEVYKALATYQREGKNAHDDAADALTGMVELITEGKTGMLEHYKAEAEKWEAKMKGAVK